MTEPTTPDSYAERIETFSASHREVQRVWSLLGNIRLGVIIALAVVAWQWWNGRSTGMLLLGAALVIAYLALVVVQRVFRQRRDALQRMVTVNERALARREHRWNDLPEPPDAESDRDHPYAYDLNVVGRASLAHRISTPSTRHGWDALYRSLLTTGDPTDLSTRQEAVAELAAHVDLQQRVEAAGIREDDTLPDPAALVAWAGSPAWLRPRLWLRVLGWIGPIAVITLFLLWAFDIVDAPLFVIPIGVNGVIFALWGQEAARRVQAIVPLREAVAGYRDMFSLIASANPRAERLREIDDVLEGDDDGALGQSAALARIVSLAIPPGAIIYFPLQLAFLWDMHVLEFLEAWQSRAGKRVGRWLDAIGEWEALAAFSVLRRDHPEWAFPQVAADAMAFSATALAHPLISEEIAVANDVEVGPEGHFLFVTGSNMSGKSTLLRAIGANAVLAQAGAPVFADRLHMPPMHIWTCMRVEDSLEQGVSFFMAELKRLKAVVDGVQGHRDRMSLYLLDEILQGTNTGERQIASRRVLAWLARERAIGAVSSHDLELIEGTRLGEAAIQVHFAEVFDRDVSGPSMTFDYILRPGPATSSNALALMELLGFDLDDEGEGRS